MKNESNSPELDSKGNPIVRTIDADLAVVLGNAANATYEDYLNKSFDQNLSSGSLSFNYHDRFYGLDKAPWGSGYKEKFGLIYLDQNDPSTVLIAFRGTSSLLDALKDLESLGTTEFKAHKSHTTLPYKVWVGNGFFDIYSQSNTAMPISMQAALFNQLSQLKPKHIIITGHSLGCPLGSLFALDVALSTAIPQIPKITNINFASPRVGHQSWKNAYDQYVMGGSNNQNTTARIVNSHDWVPTLPGSGFPTYFRHVGPEFPVSFTLDHWSPDLPALILSWHSLNNYQTVIKNAVFADPQGWSGKFTDAPYPSWQMVSKNPFLVGSTPKADWLESAMREKKS